MTVRSVRTTKVRTRAKKKLRPRHAADGARAVAAALQGYADRGIFRGLSMSEGRSGRREFTFLWLTRTPMRVTYDPRTSVLTFANLMPNAASMPSMVAGVKGVVEEHRGAAVPAHRRVDARRAQVRCTVRGGDMSLSFIVRGSHHGYVVQTGLNLVNRMFLHLQTHYPGYLNQQFGFSDE